MCREEKVLILSVIRRIVISVRKAEADRSVERILLVSSGQPLYIIIILSLGNSRYAPSNL